MDEELPCDTSVDSSQISKTETAQLKQLSDLSPWAKRVPGDLGEDSGTQPYRQTKLLCHPRFLARLEDSSTVIVRVRNVALTYDTRSRILSLIAGNAAVVGWF